ncbi:ferredoxin-thioredoxin reductase, variable chain-like [Olea europaea subsp. europaea]|uniref:Ferredoxin-thioredoxin reductase, variable chain-like n=1 Tax=Olea europaea subsp. europaea TaxID=158383 RepID=A0A8S0RQA2_OLEEU|nr:ferredoxin-thioredoxin reductase, variable chain-like [Olea europaea subsp. europaea]
MTISSAFFSSLLNVSTSEIPNPGTPFAKIKCSSRRRTHLIHFHSIRSVPDSISIVDNQPAAASSSAPSSSATTTNSVSLDDDSVNDDEVKKAESIIGAKVRIKVPLKVYHVPKVPEYELTGKVGVVKQYVGVHKGKKISANLPYKVEFVVDEILGRGGKPVKFLAHLRDDEFEFLD